MLAEINAKFGTFTEIEERLAKLEAVREQAQSRNNRRDNTDNSPNLNNQLLKSMKIDISLLMDVMTQLF